MTGVPGGSAKIDAISSPSRATPGVLTSQITGSPHTRRARSKIDSPSRISVSSFSGTTSSATIAMASSACHRLRAHIAGIAVGYSMRAAACGGRVDAPELSTSTRAR